MGLTKQQIDELNEIEGRMLFCKQCRRTVKTTVQKGFPNLRLELGRKPNDNHTHGGRWDCRKGSVVSESFERIEGIQDDCIACESTVTGLKPTSMELN